MTRSDSSRKGPRAIFGRSYAAGPHVIEQFRQDEAITEADTLLLGAIEITVPCISTRCLAPRRRWRPTFLAQPSSPRRTRRSCLYSKRLPTAATSGIFRNDQRGSKGGSNRSPSVRDRVPGRDVVV
jgi:hypothetical protein